VVSVIAVQVLEPPAKPQANAAAAASAPSIDVFVGTTARIAVSLISVTVGLQLQHLLSDFRLLQGAAGAGFLCATALSAVLW
jgi:hypothetical protein